MGTARERWRKVLVAGTAALAAAGLGGCVRVTSAEPPDPSAAAEALLTAQELVEARTMAFRSVLVVEDVGHSWRVEREGDQRAGVDPTIVDRVVTTCADGPDEAVLVDSPTYVKTTADENALVATQDSARSLAAVYRADDAAGDAFFAMTSDRWAACAGDALREAGGNVVDISTGPVPRLAEDRSTGGTRFSAVFDVAGAPVGVFLDVIVLRKDTVVSVLELSAVNRPFERALRDTLVDAVRDRMATTPSG